MNDGNKFWKEVFPLSSEKHLMKIKYLFLLINIKINIALKTSGKRWEKLRVFSEIEKINLTNYVNKPIKLLIKSINISAYILYHTIFYIVYCDITPIQKRMKKS